jgi:hypothetical protein
MTPQEQLEQMLNAGDITGANRLIGEEAAKTGVDPTAAPRNERGQFVTRADAPPAEAATVEFRQEVEVAPGKFVTITGVDEAEVAQKAELVQQTVAAVAEKVKEEVAATPEVKPAPLTPDELFDLGVKLSSGKVEAVDEYLDRSGYIDRALEKRGIRPADLKKQAADAEAAAWQAATDQFKSEHGEYLPNKRNMKLLAAEIWMVKGENPDLSPKSAIERAYQRCVEEETLDLAPENATSAPIIVQEAPKTPPPPKKPRSSSGLFGTGGESGTRQRAPVAQVTQAELNEAMKLPTREQQEWWNTQVSLGRVPQQN